MSKNKSIIIHDEPRGIQLEIAVNDDGMIPYVTISYETPRGIGEFFNYTALHTPITNVASPMGKRPREVVGNPKSMLTKDGKIPHPVLNPQQDLLNLTGSQKSFVITTEQEEDK